MNQVLASVNFQTPGATFTPGLPGSPFSFFQSVTNPSNDGTVAVSAAGLTIASTPFTYTSADGLDHVKYLVYFSEVFSAPTAAGQELVYQGTVSAQQTFPTPVPASLQTADPVSGVKNVNQDIRLAAAGFNVIDYESLLVFDFQISNEDIYAFYERLPFNRTEWNGDGPNYTAFSHAIPVAKRNTANPLADVVTLAIAYNYAENYVRWLINGVEVYRVERLGVPIARKYRILQHDTVGQQPADAPIIRPTSLAFGFGTFSLMDMYNPDNPGAVDNAALVDLTLGGALPEVNPLVTAVNGNSIAPTFLSGYPIPGFAGTNFGQGMIYNILNLQVYTRTLIDEEIVVPSVPGQVATGNRASRRRPNVKVTIER